MNYARASNRAPGWPVRVLAMVFALGLSVVATGVEPVAAAAPAPTFTASPNPSLAGGVTTLAGKGCAAADTVIVSLSGVGVPTITATRAADQAGAFFVGLAIPITYPPGDYSAKAQCGETGDVAAIGFTVTERGSITLVKTVGTDPNTCATTTTLTVPTGTVVYYCYTITNHTNLTLRAVSIVDDHLPTPSYFINQDDLINPGGSLTTVGYFAHPPPCGHTCGGIIPPPTATITADTTNVATATAVLPFYYGSPDPTYEATASATVRIPAVPTTTAAPPPESVAPETTTSTTPPAPVAPVATTTPTFTG